LVVQYTLVLSVETNLTVMRASFRLAT